MRKIGTTIGTILVLVIVLASGFLAFLTLPWAGSHKALVVLSGSMEPEIQTGSLVIVKPLTHTVLSPLLQEPKYHKGDIVSFMLPNTKQFVTHRIIDIQNKGSGWMYTTKGDANKEPDSFTVSESQIAGKSIMHVPYVGRIMGFAKTKQGIAALIMLPALVVLISELIYLFGTIKLPVTWRTGSFYAVGILMGIGTMIGTTHAFFSDTAASTNNIFQAEASFGTDHIVISEVQIHGANANQDFVELYNPTNISITLDGWKLRKKTSSGTESSLGVIGSNKTIPARGFFLWSNNQGDYNVSINADIYNGYNLSENNSIALKKPDDTIVDQVAWGNGTNQFIEGTIFPNNPATSQSIERKAYSTSTSVSMGIGGTDEFKGNSFDTNSNATDFYVRSLSQPQNSSSSTEAP